ncbi:MAG: NAD(+) diphosphatase [Bacteroidia bacterium]|nr:NAD(+) diphosphatase [Bacteroidia bacterium]
MIFNKKLKEKDLPEEDAWLFIIQNGRIWVIPEAEERIRLPFYQEWLRMNLKDHLFLYLGDFQEKAVYSLSIEPETPVFSAAHFKGLRELFSHWDPSLYNLAAYVSQITHWHISSQFCGRCGSKISPTEHEIAKECPQCGLKNYPRISPAIIVAVVDQERILLARSPRFPANFYSILAGFVEPGESLEECLHREVKEEVNVEVSNVRYLGSQPWPFPDSLMIGFVADYKSGEIIMEPGEIEDAQWFTRDNLPNLPPPISIARKIIDWWVEQRDTPISETSCTTVYPLAEA